MIDIIEKKIEHFVGIENKKTQIILTHTSRNVKEYLT